MKIYLYALVALLSFGSATSCGGDDDNDGSLSSEVVGTYLGTFGNVGISRLEEYRVTVSRLGDQRVRLEPTSGSAFPDTDILLEQTNSSTISAVNEQNAVIPDVVTFTTGTPQTLTFTIDLTGAAHTFQGVLQ